MGEPAGMREQRMKMKAGPDPSLSASALPGGMSLGEGARQGWGLWALIKGPGRGGEMQRARGRADPLSQPDRRPHPLPQASVSLSRKQGREPPPPHTTCASHACQRKQMGMFWRMWTIRIQSLGTFLVVQWLRIHLAMQGKQVRS